MNKYEVKLLLQFGKTFRSAKFTPTGGFLYFSDTNPYGFKNYKAKPANAPVSLLNTFYAEKIRLNSYFEEFLNEENLARITTFNYENLPKDLKEIAKEGAREIAEKVKNQAINYNVPSFELATIAFDKFIVPELTVEARKAYESNMKANSLEEIKESVVEEVNKLDVNEKLKQTYINGGSKLVFTHSLSKNKLDINRLKNVSDLVDKLNQDDRITSFGHTHKTDFAIEKEIKR